MRKLHSQAWVGAVLLALIVSLSAWADDENQCNQDSPLNFNSVAILHWYAANQAAQFPVGTTPTSVAFDGANIWVVRFNDNSVTKLRASDGAKLGTFAVASLPGGVAFDGANIWVTSTAKFANGVTKLRASHGANLGAFTPGIATAGVAFAWDADNATFVTDAGPVCQ